MCIELTCAEDGLAHRVDETAYAAGAVGQQGRYRGVCRRLVLATSMAGAPGRRCPTCVTVE